jgi:hypothetical protein
MLWSNIYHTGPDKKKYVADDTMLGPFRANRRFSSKITKAKEKTLKAQFQYDFLQTAKAMELATEAMQLVMEAKNILNSGAISFDKKNSVYRSYIQAEQELKNAYHAVRTQQILTNPKLRKNTKKNSNTEVQNLLNDLLTEIRLESLKRA